ncbi:MAG: hypothetical protein RQ847_11405 [Wenzhouxiangellaceae bacterium]|nr:hypothetical protein [Wenzhouxiangellaceae bacterium]
MKKFAIGCLGVVLVLAVAGGAVTWFKVVKPGMEFAGGIAKLGQEFSELNEAVENRRPFRAPADGALDEPAFRRFLAAQRQMRARLEGRLNELNAKYEELEQQVDQRGGDATVGEMMGAYADLTGLLIEAKRAQVDALNAHDFSLAEYAWVRDRVYRALGRSVAVAAIGSASGPDGAGSEDAPAPATIEMIEPYREELMEGHVLAWWGL